MRVIRFEANAREELLKYLGFDSTSIAAAAQALATAHAPPAVSQQSTSVTVTPTVSAMENMSIISAEETADFFGSSPPPIALQEENKPVKVPADSTTVSTPSELSPSVKAISAEMLLTAIAGERLEPHIRSALVVGNFSAAVEYCIEAGLMAEALLLAQCGEAGLWMRTQEMFFKKLGQRYPFLNILHAVVNSSLMDLVLKSDLAIWKETLAILSTYGKSDEFPALCEVGRLYILKRSIDVFVLRLYYHLGSCCPSSKRAR